MTAVGMRLWRSFPTCCVNHRQSRGPRRQSGEWMQLVKMIFAVISFGIAALFGVGLFMAIYVPSSGFHGGPFVAGAVMFLIIAYLLLLRRKV